MANKEWTKEERWQIADTLYGILCGAELMEVEEVALEKAIEIVSPEWVEAVDAQEEEAIEFFRDTLNAETEVLTEELQEELGIHVTVVKAEDNSKVIDINKHRKKGRDE